MLGSIENENKAYTYTLYAGGKGGEPVTVTGRLPQQWLVSTGSTWEGNAAGDTVKDFGDNAGGAIGAVANGAVTLGGANVGFTALANRQWSGGLPLTFNLLAEFNAFNNPIEDVIRPVTLLQAMSMSTAVGNPTAFGISAGTVIGAPFWQLAGDSGQVGGKSDILLRIGNMYVFDDMIVETVNLTQDMRLAEPGLPIKVAAEIQVATRGPITFEQFVSYMTGEAMQELFTKGDVIQKAREAGPGQRAGYSKLQTVPPTR